MSEEFKIIYKILKTLKDSMDVEEFNPIVIAPERLGISDVKWCKIINDGRNAIISMDGYDLTYSPIDFFK